MRRTALAAVAAVLLGAEGAGAHDAVMDRVLAMLGPAASDGRVEIDWAAPPPAGADITAIDFDPRDGRLAGTASSAEGLRAFNGRVRLLVAVPTPARGMPAGSTFALSDIGSVDVDLLDLRAAVATSADLVVDRAARRALPAGQPILVRDLKPVPAVNRGDVVTMVARTGVVTVSTRGKALENAARGDTVRVQNLDSRRTVVGVVVAPGVVEVAGAQR